MPEDIVMRMPTKVMLTLLLSFHVFLAYKHTVLQARLWFRGMAANHRDGRAKIPRKEVNACPSCHAFVASDVRMSL